ncbi:hypothetical protein ACFWDI_24560 [Streptomyces sp. NPDC060064]|uniref:hypothetical protein n=1 Tax=Streptomyces sp. NPDC060064 TaxID=3347049 RepID=UPI00369DBFEC
MLQAGHGQSGERWFQCLEIVTDRKHDTASPQSMTDPDYAFITLGDVTADEASVFAVWLRNSFVPASHVARFASSAALANGEETPWQRPAERMRSGQSCAGTSPQPKPSDRPQGVRRR